MELTYTLCSLIELEQLRLISQQTFVTAFEKDNDPTDFKNYIDNAFAIEKIKEELLNQNSEFFFAFHNNDIVGYFKLNVGDAQTDVKNEDSIELERIYIISKYQGKGVGKQILNYIKNLALNKNKRMLWLGVWEENKGAIRFYEGQGFEKFDTHPYYIGSDKQTDWLMRFDLGTL